MAVIDAAGIATLLQGLQGNQTVRVNSRDLPTFGGQPHEDADEFMLKFEACSTANGWNEGDKKRHIGLACQKNALKWLDANKALL